jgi:kynurenine formamidase
LANGGSEEIGMKRVTDLTGRMENGMWGYFELPGLEKVVPPVRIEEIANIEERGFFSSKLSLSTISSCYVEAGSHIIEGGKLLEEYPVERFIRPAKLVRLPEQKPRALIDGKALEERAPATEKGDALIVDTGWGRMWNKPGYVLKCPNFRQSALRWVLDRDISILAVDVPCIEASWADDAEEERGNLLAELFKKDVLLVAPLVNLESIEGDAGTLVCLPLSIASVSGAPARVVFIEES